MSTRPKIAVLMTCHNRRAVTLKCLESLKAARNDAFELDVYLVDDGSSDGTGDAAAAAYPGLRLLRGDGSLFWCGGMRAAWSAALQEPHDFYLWLNDDTELERDSLVNLLNAYREFEGEAHGRVIVVGRIVDARTERTAYGGYLRRNGLSRLRFRHLQPGERFCDAMNGNCVLTPACAVRDVGLLSRKFRHGHGDLDYGLRAKSRGYRIVQVEQPVAYGERNIAYEDKQSQLTLSNYKFILTNPKGLRPAEWYVFCRRHAGWMWPLNFAFRYVKMAAFPERLLK